MIMNLKWKQSSENFGLTTVAFSHGCMFKVLDMDGEAASWGVYKLDRNNKPVSPPFASGHLETPDRKKTLKEASEIVYDMFEATFDEPVWNQQVFEKWLEFNGFMEEMS